MILKRILKSRRDAGKGRISRHSGDQGMVPPGETEAVDLESLAAAPPESPEAERFRELLEAGGAGLSLEERLARIDAGLPPTLLAHLARNGREVEIRLAALEHVRGERLLEEVALHDRVTRVRQLALSRLDTEDVLERIMHVTRKQDARVAREARQRLDALRERRGREEAARQALERLCQEVERLVAEPAHPHLAAMLDRLANRWAAQAEYAPAELATRFRAALDAGRDRVARGEDRRQPLEALCEDLERLAALPDAELAGALAEVDRALARLAELPGPEPETDLDKRLAAVAGPLRQWRQELRAWHAHQGTVEALLAELEGGPPDSGRRERLAGLVAELPWRTRRSEPDGLRRARQLLERGAAPGAAADSAGAGHPDAEGTPASERHRQAFDTQYQQVGGALEQGDLRRARRLLGRMHKRLEQLPRRQRHAFEERLKPLSAKVQELQDWRRFAVLPKQETLCRRMEELADAPLEPKEQYDAIQALREEWKALGGSDSRESRQLWERFQAAADRAFEPCRQWFKELHARREANLAERQRVCEQLETFLESRPLQDLETGALDEIYRVAQQAWRAASPVDVQRGRQAKRRFRRAMDVISGELKRRRGGARQEKKALIEQARGLAEMEDLRAAVTEAKRLQQRWRELPALPPGEERRRHRELQGACDIVFRRLRGEHEQQEQQLDEHRRQLESLCADLRSVLDRADGDAIRDAQRAVREGYARAPEPVRRQLSREVDQLQRDARGALAALERQRWFAGIERLRAATLPVRQAELAVQGAAATPSAMPEVADLTDDLARGLAGRREAALAMLAEGRSFPDVQLQEAAAERRRLCVRAEILAGVESPPGERELRMSLQVERLSATLGEGEHEDTTEAVDRLARAWYGLTPWAAEADADQLEERFWRAISGLA